MIIFKIKGGFASQLRHYLTGQAIAKALDTTVYYDVSEYEDGYFRPYMLNLVNIPGLETKSQKDFGGSYTSVLTGEELIKIYEEKVKGDFYFPEETTPYTSFFEKYPEFSVDSNSECFKSLDLIDKSAFVEAFKEKISGRHSIGVHVRLGDFKTIGISRSMQEIKAAIGCMLKANPESDIYFFSNDIKTVMESFSDCPNAYFFDNQNGLIGDIEDFLCFSMCESKILPGRSWYSIYASYLGKAKFGYEDILFLEDNCNSSDIGRAIIKDEMEEGLMIYNNCSQEDVSVSENIIKNEKVELRYDTACYNENCFTRKELLDFWTKYYNEPSKDGKKYVLISFSGFNRWFLTGKYEKAIKLSRLGALVLLIAMRNNDTWIEKDKVIEAKDLDGKSMGFDLWVSSSILTNPLKVIRIWKRKKK